MLKGKKGLVTGVANDMSIAFAIATACKKFGAEVALTYQNSVIKKRIVPIAEKMGVGHIFECDASRPESVQAMFSELLASFGNIDFFVHSIAFSDKSELKGRYVDTTLDNFLFTMNVSCYSFALMSRYAAEAMHDSGGSILTLSYYGAEKVIPNYNVMGVAKAGLESSVRYVARDLGEKNIRVNAISAGPIKTLAAMGISDFKQSLKINAQTAILKRNIVAQEVGKSAVYLLSDLSSGVTGEIIHVDAGYHAVGSYPISA